MLSITHLSEKAASPVHLLFFWDPPLMLTHFSFLLQLLPPHIGENSRLVLGKKTAFMLYYFLKSMPFLPLRDKLRLLKIQRQGWTFLSFVFCYSWDNNAWDNLFLRINAAADRMRKSQWIKGGRGERLSLLFQKIKNYSGRQVKEGVPGRWNLMYKKSSESTQRVFWNRWGASCEVRDDRCVGRQWGVREQSVKSLLIQGGRWIECLWPAHQIPMLKPYPSPPPSMMLLKGGAFRT